MKIGTLTLIGLLLFNVGVFAQTAPAISSQPTDVSVCMGANTGFSITTGDSVVYQWQRSSTGVGGPFADITTGTDAGVYGSSFSTASLTISAAPDAMNGYAYRVIISDSGGSDTSAVAVLSVIDAPVVGAITGSDSICTGTQTLLADTSVGGIWLSADTGLAVIDSSGNLTSKLAGVVTVSYAVTNSCGTSFATLAVSMDNEPTVNSVTGGDSVCVGSSIVLADSIAGGLWTSSDTTVATIDSIGNVTGIAQGLVWN